MSLDKVELKKELETQDNLCTADPFYIVYEKIRYTSHREYNDGEYMWEGDENNFDTDDDLTSYIKENFESLLFSSQLGDETFEIDGIAFTKWYYQELPRYKQGFFTRKAAESYIKQNKHNLTEPYIYVESLYRNYEMQDIRNHFMEKEQ